MRLAQFVLLYAASMFMNVGVNSLTLDLLPNTEILIHLKGVGKDLKSLFAMKMDKFAAFFIATAVSSVFNFLGQKYWVFKEKKPEDTPKEVQS
jgi:putative flippase GtrA